MKVSQQPNVGGERPPREELCPIGGGPHPLALNSPGKSVEPPRSMTPWILRGIAQETSVVQSSPHEVVQSSLHLDTNAGGGDDDVTASIRPSGISRFQLVLEKESGVLGS